MHVPFGHFYVIFAPQRNLKLIFFFKKKEKAMKNLKYMTFFKRRYEYKFYQLFVGTSDLFNKKKEKNWLKNNYKRHYYPDSCNMGPSNPTILVRVYIMHLFCLSRLQKL